jgi:uncharacterized protein YehS (DUF1456 family)
VKALERRIAKLEAGRRVPIQEWLQKLSDEELTAELNRLINQSLGRPSDHPITAAEREQRARECCNEILGRPLDCPVTEADHQRVSAQVNAQLKRRR